MTAQDLTTNLAELTGSEKQIAWANTLRETALDAYHIKGAFLRLYEQDKAQDKEAFKALCADVVSVMKKAHSAEFWIDNRGESMVLYIAKNLNAMRAGGRGSCLQVEDVIKQAGVIQ